MEILKILNREKLIYGILFNRILRCIFIIAIFILHYDF